MDSSVIVEQSKIDYSGCFGDANGTLIKPKKLRSYYCTKCGMNHNALTLCPVFQNSRFNSIEHKPLRDPYRNLLTNYSHLSEKNDKTFGICEETQTMYGNYGFHNNTRFDSTEYKAFEKSFSVLSDKNENECTCPLLNEKSSESCEESQPVLRNDTFFESESISKPRKVFTESKQVQSFLDSNECDSDESNPETEVNPELFKNSNKKYLIKRLHGAGTNAPKLLSLTESQIAKLLNMKSLPAPATATGKSVMTEILNASYLFHRNPKCQPDYTRVPPTMGWLWNVKDDPCSNIKPRPGWRPGAMSFAVAQIIRRHKAEAVGDVIKKKPKKKKRDDSGNIQPMIVITKKQKCYLITMNPIPNPYIDSDDEDQKNEECAPIHFLIDRRKPKIEKIKDTCECTCECSQSSSENETNESDDSSSSDSEFEIEFTPPICLVDHEAVRKKRNIVDIAIQTEQKETKKKGKGKKKK